MTMKLQPSNGWMHIQRDSESGRGFEAGGNLGEIPKQFWGCRGLSRAEQSTRKGARELGAGEGLGEQRVQESGRAMNDKDGGGAGPPSDR